MKFFNYDNPVFKAISVIGDMLILSLLWVVTSLPVFTIGASTTALYDCAIKILRSRNTLTFKDYFRSFGSNFKQATAIFLIMLPIGALLAADLYFWAHSESEFSMVFNALGIGLALIYAATLVYVFPVQAVFNNKVKDTIRTAFLMSLQNWTTTIPILAVLFGISYLCWKYPIAAYIYLMIGNGAFALIFGVRFLVIFRKYNKELEPDVPDDDLPPSAPSAEARSVPAPKAHYKKKKGNKVIK
ncbi:MAG: DUF624 domain-containing protein [Oscillospiraceae bacterium]|nr:DUF624 domain-containing protein [Oscillospiraceae bacterium]